MSEAIVRNGTLPPEDQWPEMARIAVQGRDGVWVFGTFADAEPNEAAGGWDGLGHGWWYPEPRFRDRAPEGDDWRHSLVRHSARLPEPEEFPPEAGMGVNEPSPEEALAERRHQADPQVAAEAAKAEIERLNRQRDAEPGAAYQRTLAVAIDDDDVAAGFVEVRLDPYRICDLYRVGGGPREAIVRKILKGVAPGQTEHQVIAEIESALRRWREMLEENARLL